MYSAREYVNEHVDVHVHLSAVASKAVDLHASGGFPEMDPQNV